MTVLDLNRQPSPAAPPLRPAIDTVPVGLRVEGKLVVVVGAGPIAARKASVYAERGAVVRVVAPEHSAEMDGVDVAERHVRAYESSDLDGAWFAVAATGIPEVDGRVFDDAEQRRVWCNAADDPDHCSVILPAVVREGDLTVSISSGGRSPAAASWLRRRITGLLDEVTMTIVDTAASVRDQVRAAGHPTEVPGWAEVLDGPAELMVRSGRVADLERALWLAVTPDEDDATEDLQ